jgi:hypothetical protein
MVNGIGPSVVAGGPAVYDTIQAKSFETEDEKSVMLWMVLGKFV